MSEVELDASAVDALEAAPVAAQPAPLDRLLRRPVVVNWELLGWLLLLVAAVATRLWFLGDRAMSHDESLHTFYSWRLYNGEGYVHDPMMHGPFLYHLSALMYFLFGVSDFTARLITVFLGVGLVLTPLLLRRYLGPVGALLTGLMLLISPTVMYYTRYIRHDIHVEFFIVVLAAAMFKYLDTRRGHWIVVAAVSGACAITSAEMSYIMGFLLVLYFILALAAERVGPKATEYLGIVLGVAGLGLLLFAVFAATGRLGSIDKETTLYEIKQASFLFSGVMLALALGVGLLARFGTAVTNATERSGSTLRDLLPRRYFAPESGGLSPAVLGIAGLVITTFGYFLITFLLSAIGTSACDVGSSDAKCVMAGLLGMGLPALGIGLLLLSVIGVVARGGSRWTSLVALLVGLVPLGLGLLAFRIQHPADPSAVSTLATWLTDKPAIYMVDGLLLAAGLVAFYGLLSWLLEWDEERGLAEAFAAISTGTLVLAVVAFLVVYVLFFTTFFSNPKGIYGFWDSVKYWVEQHDVVRGDQPWYYYGIIAPMYEFLPLTLALVAILVYSLRPALRVARGNDAGTTENPEPGARLFVPLLITWSIGVFWIFSWAGEKMPWLIVHLVVPQAFLAGRLLADTVARVDWVAFRSRGWQMAGLVVLLLLTLGAVLLPFARGGVAEAVTTSLPVLGLVVVVALVYGVWVLWRQMGAAQAGLVAALSLTLVLGLVNLRYSLMANFVNDELATEYIVYAHGTPDDKLVYDTLRDLQRRVGIDKPLKIIYDDDVSWPFTWYFRSGDWADTSYVGKKPSGSVNADVALVGSANYSNFEPYLGKRYVSTEFTRMWWPNEGYKGLTLERLKEAILDPKQRRNWLDILLYRRYVVDPTAEPTTPKPLTDWFHHSNMRMYVSKDLIEKAWPLVQSRPEWLRSIDTSVVVDVPELTLARDVALPTPPDGRAFSAPKDVALGAGGDIYALDHGNKRVLRYGTDGGYKATIGDGLFTSTDNGEPSAWGIGVAPDGTVYVADTWNHRIVQFDDTGKQVDNGAWGSFGNPEDKTGSLTQFFGPRDVAVGPDGKVYVTDTGNSRVLIFDAKGNPERAITDAGSDLGAFNEPTSLAFDPATGELYVLDLWNKRIVRFKPDLTPDSAWDIDGWDSQEAAHKAYLAVGPNGVVVFSDPSAQRVSIYDRNGKPLGNLSLPMDEQGLDQPIGVAVDASGRIIVAASNSGQVTRYVPADVIMNASAAPAVPPADGAAGQSVQPSPSPTAQEQEPPAESGVGAEPQPSATGQVPAPNPRPVQP